MIKLIYQHKDHNIYKYNEDIIRLIDIFYKNRYEVTYQDIYFAWKELSEHLSAGWIILPKDDRDCFYMLRNYLVQYVNTRTEQ